MSQGFAGKLNGKQKAIGFILLIPTYIYVAPMLIQAGLYAYVKYIQPLDSYTLNILLNFFIALVIFLFEVILLKDFLVDNIKKFKERLLENIVWSFTAGIGVMYAIAIVSNTLISLFIQNSFVLNES